MNRKDEHISLARAFYKNSTNSFDDISFINPSVIDFDFSDVDLNIDFFGKSVPPIYINAMTGGSAKACEINRSLAKVANKYNIPMATGSLSAALKDESLEETFTVVRKENPSGFVMANIGAEKSLDQAKKVIEIMEADALQVHVNLAQELVMPEGDRDFTNWLNNIDKFVNWLDIPVIVKEVGFGMSRQDLEKFASVGVKNVDLSGRGGTNFIQIENARRKKREFTYLEDMGLTGPESLLDTSSSDMTRLVSGGIRNPLDVVKALSLGAKSVGIAGLFLKKLTDTNEEELDIFMSDFLHEIKVIMTMLGAKKVSDLMNTDLIISGNLRNFAELRNIDCKEFANRNKL